MRIKVLKGIRALCQQNKPATVGSLFSGTEVTVRTFAKLEKQLDKVLNRSRQQQQIFRPIFSCERAPEKQAWIREQLPDLLYLFSEAGQLAQARAYDELSGDFKHVPAVDILTAGFSCTSRSKANNRAAQHKDCVQKGEGETGLTFFYTKKFIVAKKPRVFILENVEGLCEGGEESDAAFIMAELSDAGYAVACFKVEASRYGSMARRLRLYFIGIRQGPNSQHKLELIRGLLEEMALEPGTFLLGDFLLDPSTLTTSDLPPWPRAGNRKEPAYEAAHEDAAFQHKIKHPITEADIVAHCGDALLALPWRSRELAYLMHRIHPMPDGVEHEFLDTNPSFERAARDSSSPWAAHMMNTLIGSTKPVLRFRGPDGVPRLRCLAGREMMAMVGWGAGDYIGGVTSTTHVTLCSLAGNAFSAFAVGPVLLATLPIAYAPLDDQ